MCIHPLAPLITMASTIETYCENNLQLHDCISQHKNQHTIKQTTTDSVHVQELLLHQLKYTV